MGAMHCPRAWWRWRVGVVLDDVHVSGEAWLAWGVCGTSCFQRKSTIAIPLVHGPRRPSPPTLPRACASMFGRMMMVCTMGGRTLSYICMARGLGSIWRHMRLSTDIPWPSRGLHRTIHVVHAWVRTWTSVGARETAPPLDGMLRAHLPPHLPQGKHAWAWVESDVQGTYDA